MANTTISIKKSLMDMVRRENINLNKVLDLALANNALLIGDNVEYESVELNIPDYDSSVSYAGTITAILEVIEGAFMKDVDVNEELNRFFIECNQQYYNCNGIGCDSSLPFTDCRLSKYCPRKNN